MTLLIISFIAGVLTVAAPCILPLLPVVIGGSLLDDEKSSKDSLRRPLIISLSLAFSVIVFTLLIKATTALLGVPQFVWQAFSGGIVLLLGVSFLWPHAWETVSARSGFFGSTNVLLGKFYARKGWLGLVLTGMALGPVFSSCSPTYALIVATVLPVSFIKGFVYLLAYVVGMSGTLLLLAIVGREVTHALKIVANPKGWFKRIVGILFIIVGLFVLLGLDKKLQTFVLDQGWYDPISGLEQRLRR